MQNRKHHHPLRLEKGKRGHKNKNIVKKQEYREKSIRGTRTLDVFRKTISNSIILQEKCATKRGEKGLSVFDMSFRSKLSYSWAQKQLLTLARF